MVIHSNERTGVRSRRPGRGARCQSERAM